MAAATWVPDVAEVTVPEYAFVCDAKTLTELSAKLGERPTATNNAAAKTRK
jgi:hypothetical protein